MPPRAMLVDQRDTFGNQADSIVKDFSVFIFFCSDNFTRIILDFTRSF